MIHNASSNPPPPTPEIVSSIADAPALFKKTIGQETRCSWTVEIQGSTARLICQVKL